jgi:hypothetical protein
MYLSESAIDDLAHAWVELHRSAAQAQIELVIAQLRRSGDVAGAAETGRIFEAVRRKQSFLSVP